MGILGNFEDHLSALRSADDGWAVTIWKDGTWKLWSTLDAKYAEREPNWLSTLSGTIIEADRAVLAATGHKMQARIDICQ